MDLPEAAGPGQVTPAEVTFHFNVGDRLQYACRLLRKGHRAGHCMTVLGDAVLLERLDRLLWTFDPLAFVPHVRADPEGAVPAHLVDTPIWLVEAVAHSPVTHRVLLQLHDTLPQGLERFDRLHEVVSSQPDEREAARERWRRHAAAGRTLVRHDAAEASA